MIARKPKLMLKHP